MLKGEQNRPAASFNVKTNEIVGCQAKLEQVFEIFQAECDWSFSRKLRIEWKTNVKFQEMSGEILCLKQILFFSKSLFEQLLCLKLTLYSSKSFGVRLISVCSALEAFLMSSTKLLIRHDSWVRVTLTSSKPLWKWLRQSCNRFGTNVSWLVQFSLE